MGFFKKIFRPVRKITKKIIPKEVRPFLPYIAAGFGPAGTGTFASGIKAALQRGLIAGATSAATDEEGNPLRTGILAAAPGLIADTAQLGAVNAELAGMGKTAGALERTTDFIRANEGLKTIAAQTAIDQSARLAEINQDEIDRYNEELRKQGVLDKTKRRTSIFNIYKNAGYDDDYVNSMLDRYGYDEGGLAELFKDISPRMRGFKAPMSATSLKRKSPIIEIDEDTEVVLPKPKPKKDKDDDDDRPIIREKPKYAEAMKDAVAGIEAAFGVPFGGVKPAEFKRFAKGGEVEIEEEDDDEYFNILDFMKEQNIPYGEQASYGYNEAMSDTFDMYNDMKKNGLIPPTMSFDEFLQEVVPEMGSKRKEGIMQMASSYRDPMLEEMYEQYVFEMEELGVTPMSFDDFKRQALSGMKDGGKVKRRRKGEPADEVIEEETQEEYFLDKMPKPRRQGIMEAADGGIMEKDMRGGGFIPEGSKERADDVPARLSKNEFVMTADAVRAAGGGSVNKGAKRMYDMMYQLEGQV